MPQPCTPTGNEEWTGEWTFRASIPRDVITGQGGAVAMRVTYMWRRPFRKEFVCCEGEAEVRFWVDGYWAYHLEDLHGAGFPVIRVAVGLPIPGLLGDIASALGADVTIAQWWASQGQADGHRSEGPGPDDQGNAPEGGPEDPPRAECGEFVTMPDGTRIPWDELTAPDPDDPDDPDDGEVPLRPVPEWAAPESDCCRDLPVHERFPVVEFTEGPTVELDGSVARMRGVVRVSHPCGMRRVSIREFYWNPDQTDDGHWVELEGMEPLYDRHRHPRTGTTTLRWTGGQYPLPIGSGEQREYRVILDAVSECGAPSRTVIRFPTAPRGATAPGCLPGIFRWPF